MSIAADQALTLHDAAAALRAGTMTSTELTTSLLERIDAHNEALGAFVTVMHETAMEEAAAADADFSAGVDKGPLQGIPLAIKDIIAVKGAPTTANSRAQDEGWYGGEDAPVVARLKSKGAVMLGKATTSEYATGSPDPEKGFLIPRNVWNPEHTAAGSSSGTGVAIAAGMALGGLGTDTGGSVRGPAAVNGFTGLKVTFGRVPKNGVIPLAYTLDSVGPMARSALDCAYLLEAMAGYDAGDPFAADVPVEAYGELVQRPIEGLKIGVAESYFFDRPELDDEVKAAVYAAIDALVEAGAVKQVVEVPHADEAKAANNIIGGAEAFAYHRTTLAGRWTDYGRNTRTNLTRGAVFSSADYVQAQRFRTYFRREVAKVFNEVDLIITPAMVKPAARIDEMGIFRDYVAPTFTGHWNLAGCPAAAVPCGFSSQGLPLSVQIVGKPFGETAVLQAAHAYQQVTDWHLRVAAAAAWLNA